MTHREMPKVSPTIACDPGCHSSMSFLTSICSGNRDISTPASAASSDKMTDQLTQLATMTKIVADTGDIESIRKYTPLDVSDELFTDVSVVEFR